MSEKDLCHAIVEYLNYNGCYVWRTNSGAIQSEYNGKKRLIRLNRAGTSDILGIRRSDGKFIAIEVKKPETRNRVTQAQEEFLNTIASYGGIAGVATSPEEALEIINENTKEV